jgi:LysM repeat protein
MKIYMRKRIFITVVGFLILGQISLFAASLDSLRIEYIDGKAYIIHQVDLGETLYSISKRYKTPMDVIADASPDVKKGLLEGMILRIPYIPQINNSVKEQTHIVAKGETLYSISRAYNISILQIMEWNNLISNELKIDQVLKIGGDSPPQKIDYILNGVKIHVVQAGEGLYALARNFDVTVEELVEWNGLTSSSLNLGQEVIVGKNVGQGPIEDEPLAKEEPVVVENVPLVAAAFAPMIKAKENGLAASIEGEANQTFLGLHRDIPIGTLVAVRNEMNDQVVFVRIIGKLPDTGLNDKVIIRLSQGAVAQLHAIDPKFRVEISYLIAEE